MEGHLVGEVDDIARRGYSDHSSARSALQQSTRFVSEQRIVLQRSEHTESARATDSIDRAQEVNASAAAAGLVQHGDQIVEVISGGRGRPSRDVADAFARAGRARPHMTGSRPLWDGVSLRLVARAIAMAARSNPGFSCEGRISEVDAWVSQAAVAG